ncbi:MerR family transcriptional regulator [Pseudactinotalea sp. Z1732]|uniref:MerR family transcriptional regulator n=1 Tax=Micrococcales TaxID=85006 RepID=UPI003C7E3650
MNISDFARAGRISVRMLRHYDHIGLLTPAHVDARTGHRTYAPEQLPRLHRLLALKTLGFSLAQVGEMLEAGVDLQRLRTMLAARRDELNRQVRADRHRLARVEARLALLQEEPPMNTSITTTTAAAMHLAAVTDEHPGPDRGSAVAMIEPLFTRASDLADEAGIDRIKPVGYYPHRAGGVHLATGFEIGPDEAAVGAAVLAGLEVVEVPPATVATLLHVGEMSEIGSTYAELGRWAGERGVLGPCTWREVYLEADGTDQSDWVVQVQLELAQEVVAPGAE